MGGEGDEVAWLVPVQKYLWADTITGGPANEMYSNDNALFDLATDIS